MTTSMVNGIVKQLAGKIEIVDGHKVVGVLAEYKISESMYEYNLIALLLTFVVMRIIAYLVIYAKCTTTK